MALQPQCLRSAGWLTKLPFAERFVVHRNTLFAPATQGVAAEPWGAWDDPLPVALPERAMLEFLDEVPARQSLEHAALLMQGLHDLNSRRVLQLLGL